jgi:hypothetical protein
MRLQTVLRVAACCISPGIGIVPAGLAAVLQPARFDEVTDDVARGSPEEPEFYETVIDDGFGRGSDGALAGATLDLSGGGGQIRSTACAPPERFPGGDCAGDPFEATLDAAGFPGAVFTVTLEASASGGPAPSTVGSLAASAFVDPVVAIDPGFARRDEFRLRFSDGVNPVPEPDPSAGVLAGVAALVALIRSSARARTTREA